MSVHIKSVCDEYRGQNWRDAGILTLIKVWAGKGIKLEKEYLDIC